jgi:hypothetical protein
MDQLKFNHALEAYNARVRWTIAGISSIIVLFAVTSATAIVMGYM